MNTPLTFRDSIDKESEMMPQDPPSWIIRWTGWGLLGGFLFTLLMTIVIRLPETVHCPFILVPSTGADPVQAPHQGVISRVLVHEGQPVKKGAELFALRSDEIRTWETQRSTLTEDLHTREQSLERSDAAYQDQLKIKLEEIEQAKSEVKFRQNYAKTSRDLATRMERLAKKGGMSQVELIKLRLDSAGAEKDFSVAQRTLQQTILDRERMDTEHAKSRSEEQAEIQKLKVRIAALQSDLENATQNLLMVRSPYDGVVISLTQRTVGSVVQQGQVLCQLAQQNAKVRARMVVGEAGLSKLAVAQRVRYFFDAFPYQRYGAVDGRLDWVSPSAVASGDGASQFIALGSLARTTIPSGRAKSLPLCVGMKGEAHIIVGGHTMIEYAFEPIRQLRENMKQ
jgi:multidrug efflux pump subunit AcrA (membrane-fusion protein)